MDVETCPKCGALAAPQLKRCRQCGHYLHGSQVEGWLSRWVPEPLREAPVSGGLLVALTLTYLILAVAALPSSPLGLTSNTLRWAGGMQPSLILLGEWWRVITANLLHHDVAHLGINMLALLQVGPHLERILGPRKALVIYLLAGPFGMACSFAASAWIFDARFHIQSAGASGAITGLIGATWVAARRCYPSEPELAAAMQRWAGTLLIIGLLVPFIDNFAHVGGFVAGAALARLVAPSRPENRSRRRLWSAASWGLVMATVASAGLAVVSSAPFPIRLDYEAAPPTLLGFELSERADWSDSSQYAVLRDCGRAVVSDAALDEREFACRRALLAVPTSPMPYELLAQLAVLRGEPDEARRLRAVEAMVREGR